MSFTFTFLFCRFDNIHRGIFSKLNKDFNCYFYPHTITKVDFKFKRLFHWFFYNNYKYTHCYNFNSTNKIFFEDVWDVFEVISNSRCGETVEVPLRISLKSRSLVWDNTPLYLQSHCTLSKAFRPLHYFVNFQSISYPLRRKKVLVNEYYFHAIITYSKAIFPKNTIKRSTLSTIHHCLSYRRFLSTFFVAIQMSVRRKEGARVFVD